MVMVPTESFPGQSRTLRESATGRMDQGPEVGQGTWNKRNPPWVEQRAEGWGRWKEAEEADRGQIAQGVWGLWLQSWGHMTPRLDLLGTASVYIRCPGIISTALTFTFRNVFLWMIAVPLHLSHGLDCTMSWGWWAILCRVFSQNVRVSFLF